MAIFTIQIQVQGSFSGPLKRKGFLFGIPQACFCELVNHELIIKKSTPTSKVEKTIPITPDTRIDIVDDKYLKFAVKNPGDEENVFIAENPEQAMSWLITLRAATLQGRVPLSMDNFNIISTLGRGSYGKVMLVEMKSDHQRYAIKTVRKSLLVPSHKVHTIFTERNILVRVKHPFIVELVSAFQTESKFYLVLEYASGGELFTYVKRRKTLPVTEARLYIAEVALALEYLHQNGIIYRDLKTENVLLAEDGHVKLADFGLSKDVSFMEATTSFCGTNEYLAPDILKRLPYTCMVDWWSLGIFTYEILFGATPFESPNKSRMFRGILSSDPQFPPNADSAAVDFIQKLLEKNPHNRAKLSDLKTHPFWGGLNFDDVLAKKITPLHIPNTKGNDVANFDPAFTREPAADSVASPVMQGSSDFTGFSYNNMVDPDL